MIETCRICLQSNEKMTSDIQDYLGIVKRISQIDLILDGRLSSKVCEDCVNDLFNADLLRDMLLKCNEPKIESSEDLEGELMEMYEDEMSQDDVHQSFQQYEEKFKVPQVPADVKPIKITFKCQTCSKEFVSVQCLNDHLVHQHSNLKAKRKSVRTKRIKEEEARYECHRCNISVKRLPLHMSTVHPNEPLEFKCKYCDKICNKIKVLQTHMHDHHRAAEVCEECGATFKRKSRLIDHQVSVHIKIKEFVCDFCEAKFARRCGLIAHIRCHTGAKPFKCKYCPKAYSHYSDFRTHEMSHTGEWHHYCPICNKGFYKPSTLKNHMKSHLK